MSTKLHTPREVGEILSMSEATVRLLCQAGLIGGRLTGILAADIPRIKAERKEVGNPNFGAKKKAARQKRP